MSIRVLVNGAKGRMGQETVKTIEADPQFQLVAACDAEDDLAATIRSSRAEVVVDFTTLLAAFENARIILAAGAHPVIGTTGFSLEQVQTLQKQAKTLARGGIIAPNFSLGAVLMMKHAAEIARYLPAVEIIELHHDAKLDSPSGTAIKTAEMIGRNRPTPPSKPEEKAVLPHARGATHRDIHIHSVRLPGLVAHQTILFGGDHETLTIRHDSIHRLAFMPGIKLACQKVLGLKELVYGLENILD